MGQLMDDLVKAQPDVLFIIAGLLLIGIGVVGSIKTYIDPGKYGRIAALSIGVVLVVVGFVLYGKQPASMPAASAATQTAPASAGRTRTCKFTSGPDTGAIRTFPRAAPFPIGGPCYNNKSDHGVGVADPSIGVPNAQ
jgi:hypothetical protein